MNRLVFTIILSVFCTLLAQSNSFAQESQEIVTNTSSENKMFPSSINPSYQNQLYGFSLNAPDDWIVQENSQLVGGNEAAIVSFYSNKPNEEYTANFFILYHNLTPEYLDLLELYSQEELLDQLSSTFIASNTKIINKDMKVYSDGYKITVEYAQTTKISEEDFATLHRETVLFVQQNGETYSLQFASLPEDFDDAVKKFRDSVDTFYVGRSQSIQGIVGGYANNDLNFGFIIPEGWSGIQGSDSDTIVIMPATYQKLTDNLPEYAMAVSVLDESYFTAEPTAPDTEKNNCIDSITYKIINRIPVRATSSECDDQLVKGYHFAVKDGKFVSIAYLTKNPSDKKKMADFEKLVSSLRVEKPLQIKDGWRKAHGIEAYEQKITVGDSSPTIKYYSNSQVTNFAFDQENKRFSFAVSESDNSGTTIIPASKVIEGPYRVLVDGKSVKTDLIEDHIEGITEVSADYQKGDHAITIEGKQLVSGNQALKKPVCGMGTVEKDGVCVPATQQKTSQSQGGGCLIATATYGTELAPQVQLLRELRDHTLLQTNSGSSFMIGFNAVYYSFSPTIADLERQNPMFRDIVKLTMMPMLSTLSILNYVAIDSEQEMLAFGIGIVLLNLGMYFVVPALIIRKATRNLFHFKKMTTKTFPQAPITEDQFNKLRTATRNTIWALLEQIKILIDQTRAGRGNSDNAKLVCTALYTHCLEEYGKLVLLDSCKPVSGKVDLSGIKSDFFDHNKKITIALKNLPSECSAVSRGGFTGTGFTKTGFTSTTTPDWETRLDILNTGIQNNGDLRPTPTIDIDLLDIAIDKFHADHLKR